MPVDKICKCFTSTTSTQPIWIFDGFRIGISIMWDSQMIISSSYYLVFWTSLYTYKHTNILFCSSDVLGCESSGVNDIPLGTPLEESKIVSTVPYTVHFIYSSMRPVPSSTKIPSRLSTNQRTTPPTTNFLPIRDMRTYTWSAPSSNGEIEKIDTSSSCLSYFLATDLHYIHKTVP